MNIKTYLEIKKLVFDLLIVLLSFSFIVFYIYWRVTRKQYQISLIPEEVEKHFFMFSYFFLLNVVILSILLLSIYLKSWKTPQKKKELGYFGKVMFNIAKRISPFAVLYKGYSLVFHWIKPIYMQHVVTYANNIVAFTSLKNKVIILLAVVLPRALIILTLLLEIYLKTLHYYFFSLLLLLIPLIFRFLLFVYTDISKQVLPKLNELVERVPNTDITLTINGETQTFGTLGYRFKPEFAYAPTGERMDLNHFMRNLYNPMLFIGPHMEVHILPLYEKYTTITVFVYLNIQIICWGYILFFI